MSSTNFPRILPVEQVRKLANLLLSTSTEQAPEWPELLRDCCFALGTLITYSKGTRPKLTDALAMEASELSDDDLANRILELTENKQGLLRGSFGLLKPELIVLIIELILRIMESTRAELPNHFAATQEPVADDEDTPAQADATGLSPESAG